MTDRVNWLIGTTFEQRRKEELLSILHNYGDNVYLYKPFEYVHRIIPEERFNLPTISLCSLAQVHEVSSSILYPGVYCNLDNFKCTTYYPYYSKYLLNSPYCMMPYGDLLSNKESLFKWLGNNNSLFIRPNSGFKDFTGQVVNYETFERDLAGLESVEPDKSLLCVVSEPQNIETEWRLVIVNKKVVASSQYRNAGKHDEIIGCPLSVFLYAQILIDDVGWEPDLCYTMDICLLRNDLRLVELNSFSCSGLYECNLKCVVDSVRQCVINDWRDVYE